MCRRGKEIRKHTKNKQITLIEIILKQQKQPAAGEFFNGFGALKRQIPLKKIVPNRLKILKSFHLRRANGIFSVCRMEGGMKSRK